MPTPTTSNNKMPQAVALLRIQTLGQLTKGVVLTTPLDEVSGAPVVPSTALG